MYREKIIDAISGKETYRNYTADEIAAVEFEQATASAEQAKRDTDQAAKAAARQAVLDKLGLTADEVAALLG